MPWREADAMSERLRFVRDVRQGLVTFTELCALYGISRVTGYKWLARAPSATRQAALRLCRYGVRIDALYRVRSTRGDGHLCAGNRLDPADR